MAGVIYSPTGLVNVKSICPTGFKVVVMGNGQKVAAFLHAQLWFLGHAEP